jgi:hypothetical protein
MRYRPKHPTVVVSSLYSRVTLKTEISDAMRKTLLVIVNTTYDTKVSLHIKQDAKKVERASRLEKKGEHYTAIGSKC